MIYRWYHYASLDPAIIFVPPSRCAAWPLHFALWYTS
jgi:hypothetical protein